MKNNLVNLTDRSRLLRHARSSKSCNRLILWSSIVIGTTLILGNTSPQAGAAVVYVNGSQTANVPDGTSWSTAFTNVQSGINAATYGDAVWVAAGIYFENITLANGIALYGGFNGTESNLAQRNWTNHIAVLDGRGSNSVVSLVFGATNTTRIDGFVIRNGKAQYGGGICISNASPVIMNNTITQNQAGYGGGIACVYSPSTEIAFNT